MARKVGCEMAQNLYLEVTDTCMHACTTCPRGIQDPHRSGYFVPIDNLARIVTGAIEQENIRSVTLSGGEPLLHPNIVNIVSLLNEMGLQITMLSNLQALSDRGLANELANASPKMTIVTALHSAEAKFHDEITNHPGSYAAAITGISELHEFHMDVVIKVILSMRTCQELSAITRMALERWGKGVRFNLCGLDLCGMKAEDILDFPINFQQEGQLIEQYLAAVSSVYENQLEHYVSITEYPLCWIDRKFWNLFHQGSFGTQAYIQQGHIKTAASLRMQNTCACHARKCLKCLAKPVCAGIWWSVYNVYSEYCVKPHLSDT